MVGAFAGGSCIPEPPSNIIDLSFNLIGHYAVSVYSLQMDSGEIMSEAHDFEAMSNNCPWHEGDDLFQKCSARPLAYERIGYASCTEETCAIWQMLCNMNLEMK